MPAGPKGEHRPTDAICAALGCPVSRVWAGYWQRRQAHHIEA